MIGPLPSFDVALVLRVGGDIVYSHGDVDRVFPLASVTKPIVAWSALVAVDRGLVGLDDPAGPEGSTVRHLLAHASGLPFEGRRPVAAPEKRRIYSNEGFDILGEVLEAATGVGVAQWVREAVFEPLGMVSADIPGSPAHAGVASASDVSFFGAELARPTLVSAPLAALAALDRARCLPSYHRALRSIRLLRVGGPRPRGQCRLCWSGAVRAVAPRQLVGPQFEAVAPRARACLIDTERGLGADPGLDLYRRTERCRRRVGCQSTSTMTGTWSEAPLPLRSSRSICAPLTRAASAGEQ